MTLLREHQADFQGAVVEAADLLGLAPLSVEKPTRCLNRLANSADTRYVVPNLASLWGAVSGAIGARFFWIGVTIWSV